MSKCACTENAYSTLIQQKQGKSSLYLCYYLEAFNEWRGPAPRLSAWTSQLRRKSKRWRAVGDAVSDLTSPVINLLPPPPIAMALTHYFNFINCCCRLLGMTPDRLTTKTCKTYCAAASNLKLLQYCRTVTVPPINAQ